MNTPSHLPLRRQRHLLLFAAFALSWCLLPPLVAQVSITFNDSDDRTTATSTTSPNDPTTLSIASGTATQSGIISGSGDVIKSGAGTLVLTGSNTYSGSTTVNGGVLSIANKSALGGTSLILDGGTLNTTSGFNFGAAWDINLGAGGGTLDVDGSTTLNYASAFSGSGPLTKTGAGTLNLTADPSHSGTTTISNGTLLLKLGNLGALHDITNDATLTLDVTSSFVSWNGVISGSGDLTIEGDGTNDIYLGTDSTFTGTTTVDDSIRLELGALGLQYSTLVAPMDFEFTTGQGFFTLGGLSGSNSILVEDYENNAIELSIGNNNDDTLYTGNLSGGGSLVKIGTGTLTLFGTNSYTGTTSINGGTLQLAKRSALYNATPSSWTATNLRVASGATAAFNVGGTGEFTSSDLDTLAALGTGSGGFKNGSFIGLDTTNASGGNFAYSSAIVDPNSGSNSLGLTKLGTGTLTLTGTNTYTGGTTVSGGTLVGNTDSLQGAISTGSGTTLEFNQTGSAGTYAGSLSGSGALIKSGDKAVTLSGDNSSHSGTTTVTGSTLRITADNNLGSGQLILDGGAFLAENTLTLNPSRGITTSDDNSFIYADSGATVTFAGVIDGTGGIAKANAGTLVLTGANTYSGITVLSGGTLSIDGDASVGSAPGSATANQIRINGGTLQTTESFTLNSNRGLSVSANGGSISPDAGTSLTYNGIIADNPNTGVGPLIMNGNGNLFLGGTNTYTGGTQLNGFRINVAGDANLGAVPGSLDTDNLSFDGGDLRVTATTTLNSNRGITLNAGGGAITAASGVTVTYNGIIAGTGDFKKGGGGTVILGGANTFSGGTSIVGVGPLQLGHSDALQNSTLTTPSDPNDFSFGSLSSATFGGLSGSAMLELGNDSNDAVALTVGDNNSDTSYSGNLFGSGSLTKSGTGILTLSGLNTYTGATTVSAGTLIIANTSGNATGTGDVTIANGANLTGTGSIGGSLNVAAGGTFAPGNSAGLITIGGNFTLNSAAIINLEIDGLTRGTEFDAFDVTGNLTLGGTLNVTLIDDFTPGTSASFNLFDASSIGGTFTAVNLPTVTGATWNTTALASTGVISLSAVPEPASFALLAGLFAIGFSATLRKKK